jgi:hypothetical protein
MSVFGGHVVARSDEERQLAALCFGVDIACRRLPTWMEYLRGWKPHARRALNEVARALPTYGLLGVAAFEAASRGVGVDDIHWRCTNGVLVGFSHRGWGDVMAILTRVGDYRDWAWHASDAAMRWRSEHGAS